IFLLPLAILFVSNTNAQRIHTIFDASWKFHRGDISNGDSEILNDKSWRTLDLPHDWSIEDLPDQSDSVIGPFSIKSIGATATGYTVGGIGWYRKHFTLNNTKNKEVSIYFDGVYMNSDVFINGHHLGNHPYGYTPFSYDITPYLKKNGEENILAVRASNEGRNSRWYSGSGIYRHVWLTVMPLLHLAPWGVYITTPEVSGKTARVDIKTKLINDEPSAKKVILHTTILDAKNKIVADAKKIITIGSTSPQEAGTGETLQTFQVPDPHLWSPDAPYLYHAVSEVDIDGKVTDRVNNSFGIRSIEITAGKGFLLNGKPILLRGGCMHHDNGPLGAATIDRAEIRKVQLLKSYGFNAVRTSHNPPSTQFLDACDSVGIIVIDEAFDQWERAKNPDDYHLYFDTCWQSDISSMVLRDRNHPAVVFWSIGNEINERADAPGLAIAKKLRDEVKMLDNTRPVTEAICHFWDHPTYTWDTTAAAFALLDVGGYNYEWQEYESDHAKYPERIMMGTESFPFEAFENWQQVEKHPYVIGDFVWTAMDYLGETGIGHTGLDSTPGFQLQTFPWFNAWCGDIDITGGKKPQLYYRNVVWGQSKMEMLVHTPIPEGHTEAVSAWGWPDEVPAYTFPGDEGKKMQVHVYTTYPGAQLQLNGKTIGEQNVSAETKLTATFSITYDPGVLKAIALQNGVPVDSVILQTAGKPRQIKLTADRSTIHANRNDLSYVTAEIVDAKGHLVPDAVLPLHFNIKGAGEILATANANPSDMESFQQPQYKTFRGKCLIIVRPNGKGSTIKLNAEGEGLKIGEVVIESK
ncbi:MAG: glycoside hydrolase family 2 TIM barrel-domain containing protein, partial [Ginsengibacter sp.]